MSTEENKALARRIIEEAWNQGNMAAVDELMALTMPVTTLWFPSSHQAASSTSSSSPEPASPFLTCMPPLKTRSPKEIWS